MLERDTARWKVAQALGLRPEGKKHRSKYQKKPDGWMQPKRMTVNTKLRQAIIDLMPLEMDNRMADIILHAIFDTIVAGVVKDGYASIPGFGRFHAMPIKGRWIPKSKSYGYKKIKRVGRTWCPAHYKLAFRACDGFRHAMRDENNGSSGTDQRA